jgi:hypothetical protein
MTRPAFGIMVVAILVGSVPLFAQRAVPMNLEKLIADAGMIFSGRVVEVRTGVRDPQTNLAVTYVTFEVSESFYGVQGSTITIKQFGGEAEGILSTPAGMPRYTVGEEVLMMFYGPSKLGMQSPVGMEQGKFLIKRDRTSGKKTLSNTLGGRSLFKGLKNKEKVAERSWLREQNPEPLDYDAFARTIRALIPAVKGNKGK